MIVCAERVARIKRDVTRRGRLAGAVGKQKPGRPSRSASYLLMRRPALAEIVGDGLPRTVPMISLLSMLCE